MTMKTKEKKYSSPANKLRSENHSRLRKMGEEFERKIFESNSYDPKIKDYLCIMLVQNKTILEKMENNGSKKKSSQFSKPGIYMPMPKELQQGARIISSMVSADTWEDFWLRMWDNRREIVKLLNKAKSESNISLKEEKQNENQKRL